MSETNYAKLDYRQLAHHRRFVAYVASRSLKLVCQCCGGEGTFVEDVLYDGHELRYQCGWCEGTGLVTPHLRGLWLRTNRKAAP